MNALRRYLAVRIFVSSLWAALLFAALTLAPPAPDTWSMVKDLFWFHGPDPWLDATFTMMGLWPVAYGRILLQGSGRRVLPKLVPVAGMAFGAFALLPATALRHYGASSDGDPEWVRWFCSSRALGFGLAATAVALVAYGAIAGDPSVAFEVWKSHGFVFTYLLDFTALTAGYIALVLVESAARSRAQPIDADK